MIRAHACGEVSVLLAPRVAVPHGHCSDGGKRARTSARGSRSLLNKALDFRASANSRNRQSITRSPRIRRSFWHLRPPQSPIGTVLWTNCSRRRLNHGRGVNDAPLHLRCPQDGHAEVAPEPPRFCARPIEFRFTGARTDIPRICSATSQIWADPWRPKGGNIGLQPPRVSRRSTGPARVSRWTYGPALTLDQSQILTGR